MKIQHEDGNGNNLERFRRIQHNMAREPSRLYTPTAGYVAPFPSIGICSVCLLD